MLSTRQLVFSSGERYSLLVDERGMPRYFPTLYITVKIRGASKAANTIRNSLGAIKALYDWQKEYGLDIESVFASGKSLQAHQIYALRDFMQYSLCSSIEEKTKITPVTVCKPKRAAVSTAVQYARLTVVADYLNFLAIQLNDGSEEVAERIRAMVSAIRSCRPRISNRSLKDRDERYLDAALLDRLDEALKPGSRQNPVKSYGAQIRNALMIAILRVTGMRRGELLNLKVEDIDFSANILSIVRRPDSKTDMRAWQPVAKTRERMFPIDPLLADRIHEYVLKYRSQVRGAKRHGYLFVTHKAGPSCGQPLSIAGFSKLMHQIKKIEDDFCNVHAHALRHSWNYSFSRGMDRKEVAPEREQQLRSYLMGWNPTSGTAATYNRRHIKEEAHKAALGLQVRYLKKEHNNDRQAKTND